MKLPNIPHFWRGSFNANTRIMTGKYSRCNRCQAMVRAGERGNHGSGYCKVYSFNKGVWVGTIQTAVKHCPYAGA